ncbi:MAG: alanine--tRNA ligase [Nanobdellota archaeon]
MLSDKELKKEFKKEASKDPENNYPTEFLKKEGFMRRECTSCGTFFWTVNEDQVICGDPECQGGVNITEDNPAKNELSYINVWEKIKEMLGPRGYTAIERYPTAARWNPTTEFVIASIAAFQPYVVTGEIEPPARKLVIPQFCLRFADVDNVGITGSHMTGFVMIGQHMFVDESEWDQEKAFKDIYDYLITGVGLPKEELTLHEDAWAGGGNFGPCMEFFSRGIELFNQVYMLYEQTDSGRQPLKNKVLDMGLGMERIAWFSQGKSNIYEATFPETIAKLKEATDVSFDQELYAKFCRYSALLNADEVEDMDTAWEDVAGKINVSVDELKRKIAPMTALYSVAEHARTLLVAIVDGSLPSNVGGGYNLRLIFRRAMSFIDKNGWTIDMGKVAEWHAKELEGLFPELLKHLPNVKRVLDVEKERYYEMKRRSSQIVKQAVKKEINTETLLDLYDSKGISPEIVKEEAKKLGKEVEVPENFYALVSERHEQQEIDTSTNKEEVDIGTVSDTEILYYGDWRPDEFSAKVLKITDNHVILDRTMFYPTSGGQLHDTGDINGDRVKRVFKQGNVIIHEMENISFSTGDNVRGKVDPERREQLAEHHTSTHIVNAAAKEVLGDHVNQAGARKTLDKATLDITHYQNIGDGELREIERIANDIVEKDIEIEKKFMPREEAEKEHGMRIYQGGAVPGRKLRIVNIKGYDVEACGGTHLNRTSEAGRIKLLKSSKIQDGIVRITFTAGGKAEDVANEDQKMIDEAANLLNCKPSQIPARAEELFSLWKKAKKAKKKGREMPDLTLRTEEESEGDVLAEAAEKLKTQKAHVLSSIKKFRKQLDEFRD